MIHYDWRQEQYYQADINKNVYRQNLMIKMLNKQITLCADKPPAWKCWLLKLLGVEIIEIEFDETEGWIGL